MKKRKVSSPTLQTGPASSNSVLFKRRATAPITLITDFGSADYFVGSVKGVILDANPSVNIVDITHEIPPQDIQSAAFTLLASYHSFAPGTIHVAIVDPGVGSSRRPVIVLAGGQCFVGPDNGVFSYILDTEPHHKVVHVTNDQHFRRPLSTTFHGRDVFAPVAAALSNSVAPESFGPEISDAVRLKSLNPETSKNGEVLGRIIHIDRFGNCVTNINGSIVPGKIKLNGKTIDSVREFYGDGPKGKKLFLIRGSAGFLEVSAQNRSAAKLLNAKRGDRVVLKPR